MGHSELAERVLRDSHLSIWELFRRSAEAHRDAPAVVKGDVVISYGQLAERALRSAHALHDLGVGRGDRVVFVMPASPEWLVLHYALMRLGAVAVPLAPSLAAQELGSSVSRVAPRLLLAYDVVNGVDVAQRLREAGIEAAGEGPRAAASETVLLAAGESGAELAGSDITASRIFGADQSVAVPANHDVGSTDIAYILFTSGSTGRPKAAQVTNGGLAGAGGGAGAVVGLGPDDRFLGAVAPHHSSALAWLTACHSAGAAFHLADASSPEQMLEEIERGRCTVTMAIHTQLQRLIDHPSFADRDLSSLRIVGSGATLPQYERFYSRFGLRAVFDQYASTESSGITTISDPAPKPDRQGRPLPGIEIRIVDPEAERECAPGEPGEIRHRGWATFAGYLDDADNVGLFDADGFCRTGDIGVLDEDGVLSFRGRFKMMIKTGGENVSEYEVETFLADRFSEIDMVQVVGVPDPEWGEAVVAFLQPHEGSALPSEEELRAGCRGAISGYKIPKRFFALLSGEWPTLSNGKIDKSGLRRLAEHRYRASEGG